MYSENKFFLKSFIKNEGLKENNFNGIWNKLSVKTQAYQKEIERNIKKIGDFEAKDPTAFNLKDIYKEHQNLWNIKGTLEGVDSKKLRNYLQILFANPNEGIPAGLYDNTEQFDDFLEALIKQNKQTLLKRLFAELLYHYPTDNLFFKRLEKIYKNLDKQKRSNQALIQANTEFRFTEENSPLIIAQNILDIQKNLSFEVLSKIWLKERHLTSNGSQDKKEKGIGQAVVKKLCYLAKNYILEENEPVLKRFLEYLSGENDIKRFISPKPITEVLLRPFENKVPIQSVKKQITKFLDQNVGDPRFKSEKWINMDREKSIFLKWKIGETLKDFFELLSYTVKEEPNADKMWFYRKNFIKAYWKAGHIKEAWIVLGRKAYKNRFKFLKKDHESYGKINRRAKPIHSVLLFQIGDLVFSEWNYNGKVRLWNSSSKYTPQFYKTEYLRENLEKNSKKEFIHSSPQTYYWQKKLSEYIEKYTGISCPEFLQRKIDKFQ